jgi:glycosyltransferase involved in cell wall biosynthesis
MKILQLIQKPQLRGAEIFASQLSNHLLNADNEVKMISLLPGDAEIPYKGELFRLDRPHRKRFFDFKGWSHMAKVIRKFDPDLVQANAGDTLKFAVLSKLVFRWKAPIVFRNASTISLYIKSTWVLLFNRFLFQFVDHIVSVSVHSKMDCLKLFPFVKNKVSVIHTGIETNKHPVNSVAKNYLLHVGGFSFEKNHEGLLRIFNQLRKTRPELELWLVGDGILRNRIKKKAKEEPNLASSVKFLGYRKDVIPIMKAAKALLLPSIIEGFPGVILEAFYWRVPVVAYNVGGVSEALRHKETGWLIDEEKEEDFVQAVQEILMDIELVEKVKENAFQVVNTHFRNENIAKEFINVYQTVLSRQNGLLS